MQASLLLTRHPPAVSHALTLATLAASHASPTPATLLAWAHGDSKLVRYAESLLAMSDAQLYDLAVGYSRSGGPLGYAQWTPFLPPPDALEDSSKVRWLAGCLQRAKAAMPPSRVVVFSQFTGVLDLLGWAMDRPPPATAASASLPLPLTLAGTRYCRLDGSTPVEERQVIIDVFTNDPSIPVFLLSTRAGGVGINLACADTVVLFDSDWNPQADLQAEDRVHRMGQTRPVRVFQLLCKGSIEQHMEHMVEEKRGLAERLNKLAERGGDSAPGEVWSKEAEGSGKSHKKRR